MLLPDLKLRRVSPRKAPLIPTPTMSNQFMT